MRSVIAALRRVLALHSELGADTAPATIEVTDDPILATYHVAALAPFGPADQYRVLEAPGPDERAELLVGLLGETEETLRFRLGRGSGPTG